jgi:16S rRNA (cytidine1402-2'-O)-methyltransferase
MNVQFLIVCMVCSRYVLNMIDDDSAEQTTKKERGWLLPDSNGRAFRGGLYLVATPIGNLRDITLRALDVLAAADVIAAEDTRVSGKLLAAYDIKGKTLISYNDHSDVRARDRLIADAAGGKVVVLISDAGMPLVSDPGYKLVCAAAEAGVYVSSMPGANAPLMAMQLSGLPSDRFTFLGFLPSKSAARRDVLSEWADVQSSLIVFESAQRLVKALEDIADVMGQREVAVTRELTKMYEEVRRGRAMDLVAHYREHGLPKGEIVMVIAPPEAREYGGGELEALLRAALETMSTKDAAAHVAAQTGQAKKVLYGIALRIGDE